MEQAPKPIWFKYTYTFENGKTRTFEVQLDPNTLDVIRPPASKPPPEWTQLDYAPCDGCSLPADAKHCPIAVSMCDLVDAFAEIVSYEQAEVVVETAERKFYKKGSAQQALFPLLGIYMAAGGCPSMERLKPLVRHHLPFSSAEETIYRVITMYITAQYLRMQQGLEPDWEMAGIAELYDNINKVNRAFCKRLNKAVKQDSLMNAVVILDAFGTFVKTPTPKSVAALQQLFAPYLKK